MKMLGRLYILLFLFIASVWIHPLRSQCFISEYGSLGQLSKTTGIHELDTKLNSTMLDLEKLFRISVNLYIYGDKDSPNAFAMAPENKQFDGMVAFGQNMLAGRLWNMSKGEAAVAGILAHEFAHVLQWKNHCHLQGKERELHADFLAGYYFGKRNYMTGGLRNFALDLYSIGDYNFWSPSHHGTPKARVEAMMAGYYSAQLSVEDAYHEGMEYVRNKFSYVVSPCVHLAHPQGDRIACTHITHPNGDLVSCTHACYTPLYGNFPCHPNGDLTACTHPLHAAGDLIACSHALHPEGDVSKVKR